MSSIPADEARTRLDHLIEEIAASHRPLRISGKCSGAVLVAEEDWEAIQETLFLLSIPDMGESIRDGMATPAADCERDLDW